MKRALMVMPIDQLINWLRLTGKGAQVKALRRQAVREDWDDRRWREALAHLVEEG